MHTLQNKVALVTGASKGIGAGIAKALAAAGASVVVNYATSKSGADNVVTEITRAGGQAIASPANVAKSSDVEKLLAETKNAFGQLDILVNNAGVYHFATLEELTEKEFNRQFQTNVFGLLATTREALKHFGPGGGSVINISSVASTSAPPNSAIYSGTKGAVDSITFVLAKELAPRKIRVNAINPGPVQTEGFAAMGEESGDFIKQMVAQTPLGRLGEPADIGDIAVFLASDASRWLTGERISASGGLR